MKINLISANCNRIYNTNFCSIPRKIKNQTYDFPIRKENISVGTAIELAKKLHKLRKTNYKEIQADKNFMMKKAQPLFDCHKYLEEQLNNGNNLLDNPNDKIYYEDIIAGTKKEDKKGYIFTVKNSLNFSDGLKELTMHSCQMRPIMSARFCKTRDGISHIISITSHNSKLHPISFLDFVNDGTRISYYDGKYSNVTLHNDGSVCEKLFKLNTNDGKTVSYDSNKNAYVIKARKDDYHNAALYLNLNKKGDRIESVKYTKNNKINVWGPKAQESTIKLKHTIPLE